MFPLDIEVRRGARPPSLFWRIFLIDAAVLGVAAGVLALGPITISSPILLGELAVLVAGLAVMLLVSLALLGRALRPLATLTETMHRIDPLSPGRRVAIDAADADVAALSDAFNRMLERLENERRDSARSAVSVQEAERRRVSGELHDEVGQTLTAMLLQIERVIAGLPEELRGELDELRETARTGAHDVRRIAQRLRPDGLEELGLQSALLALATAFAAQTGVLSERRVARHLPLSREEELVVYRIAQEALANVARHARAQHAEVTLDEEDGAVVLRVRDDGRGIGEPDPRSSYGIRGMRERAMVIGAELAIHSIADRGTEVVLRIPERRRQ
jgi:two-component system, NarL family, sensor histidine kinase UhpB